MQKRIDYSFKIWISLILFRSALASADLLSDLRDQGLYIEDRYSAINLILYQGNCAQVFTPSSKGKGYLDLLVFVRDGEKGRIEETRVKITETKNQGAVNETLDSSSFTTKLGCLPKEICRSVEVLGALNKSLSGATSCSGRLGEGLLGSSTTPPVSEAVKRQLIQEGRHQELIWMLRKNGMLAQAADLEKEVREALEAGSTAPTKETLEVAGTHQPRLLQIEKTPIKGVFKSAKSHQHEIAAYVVDRLFGFDLVPITVYRKEKKGDAQSAQLYTPSSTARLWGKGLKHKTSRLKFFDFLINNSDRHEKNWSYTERDGRPDHEVALDHDDFSFLSDSDFQKKSKESEAYETRKLFTVDYVLKNPKEFDPGPEIRLALETLSEDQIKTALSPYLGRSQVNSLIKRKNQFLEALKAPRGQ